MIPLEEKIIGGVPTSTIQGTLARLYGKVLKINGVDIDDNFFDLGADSLHVVSLLYEIEQAFGVQLHPDDILNTPVVSELSIKLEKGNSQDYSSKLVPLSLKGEKQPVYWIPGGGGMSVTAFRNIAKMIAGEYPIYGLVASRNSSLSCDVSSRAKEYVALIKKHSPTGPYFLFGFSSGSWVAYEMALQFQESGDSVGGLVVFDMPVFRHIKWFERIRLLSQLVKRHIKTYYVTPEEDRRKYLEKYILPTYWRFIKNLRGKLNRQADIFEKADYFNRRASKVYSKIKDSCKFNGVITVVLAQNSLWSVCDDDMDPRLKWGELAIKGVRSYYVQGEHISMLEEPNVGDLSINLLNEMAWWANEQSNVS